MDDVITKPVDAETDREVQRRDLVRDYEFKKDHYVPLRDADIAGESSSMARGLPRKPSDEKLIFAAGAGVGIAANFNAPIE